MKHWTEDDFLHWHYTGGSEPLEATHLDECPDCRARAGAMAETRRQATVTPELPWEFLAAQRRSIYQRLSEQTGSRSLVRRWVVASASVVCIVGLSLGALHPWTGKTDPSTSSDEKLFSDLAAIEQSSEPRTIQPIHNLFQE